MYDPANRFITNHTIQCSQNIIQPIEGGETALNKEFPYTALIGYSKNITKFELSCLGALVSERFILSAAHCAHSREENEAKWAILGDFAHGTRSENTFHYEIIERLKHPRYRSHSIDYDIALYKLFEDVTFNSFVTPICLSQPKNSTEQFLSTHWDFKKFNDFDDAPLRKNNLKISKERDCNNAFRTDDRVITGIHYENKICASSVHDRRDSCWDKSGNKYFYFSFNNLYSNNFHYFRKHSSNTS